MTTSDTIYDLVGLGFGPANIAIAGAVVERWQGEPGQSRIKNALFIEKHRAFRWHPGMLLPDAKMQISFMKDLATLRNPKSPYTFMSYLHSQDRLLSFINRGSTIPTRKEYADYLSWAAKKAQDDGVDVLYGHEIIGFEYTSDHLTEVRYRDLSSDVVKTVKARNIVISPGGAPRVPDALSPVLGHSNVIHSSSYALSIGAILDSLPSHRSIRIGVLGSGQSAAEVALDVRNRLSRFPFEDGGRHQVDLLIRKGALKPSDDSPFQNEIFDPSATDAWFDLPSNQARARTYAEYKPTNYGVVNPRTLDILYEIIYDQRLDGGISKRTGEAASNADALINIKPYTNVTAVKVGGLKQCTEAKDLLLSPVQYHSSREGRALTVSTSHGITHATGEEEYDAIVYATGYDRSGWINLLKYTELGKHFGLHADTTQVQLAPHRGDDSTESPALSPTSSSHSSRSNTPPTSPDSTIFSHPKFPAIHELKISRAYRLLPTQSSDKAAAPRVYVQGVEEHTHGLSDTLLSVLGVRAGEVVADLEAGSCSA